MGRSNSKILKRLAVDWLPVLAWVAVILYIGSSRAIPLSDEGDFLRFLVRKGIHVGEYAIFGFLLYRALKAPGHAFSWRRVILVLLVALALAGFDEWRQSLTPMRSGRITDVGIDIVGSGVGFVLARIRARIRLKVKS